MFGVYFSLLTTIHDSCWILYAFGLITSFHFFSLNINETYATLKMKVTNFEDRIHVIDEDSNVTSVIKNIVEPNEQEDAFYVCDVGDMVAKYKTWKTQMPRVEPHYAVKCNDSPIVLSTLASLGLGFDCASKGEISKILKLGVEPSRIIFANPAKPASHIRYANTSDVKMMTFDSASELYKVKKMFPEAK